MEKNWEASPENEPGDKPSGVASLKTLSGANLPLESVHVKAKIVDLVAQVLVFQEYTNNTGEPIEAKYEFPLDDQAGRFYVLDKSTGVCGFEAFINGKHIVGVVKEKEAAKAEYLNLKISIQ